MDFLKNKFKQFTSSGNERKEKDEFIFPPPKSDRGLDLNNNINNSKKIVYEDEYDFQKNFSHLYDIPIFNKILEKAKKIKDQDQRIKVHKIIDELNQGGFNSLDGTKLQSLMFSGLQDELPIIRTLCWKLALNYPTVPIIHTPKWQEEIDLKRKSYFDLIKEHYKYLNEKKYSKDHPLNGKEDSIWNNYFKDYELVEEIHKDVRRTRAQMSFFFMPADKTIEITNDEIVLKADYAIEFTKNTKNKIENNFESHADVLTRILYIFAKEFPKIRYVQGMNEILAIIYYQFCLDNDCDNHQFDEYNQIGLHLKEHEKIEADSYMCFKSLMEEIQDLFIREKDQSRSGIQTKIKGVNLLLRETSKEIYNHMVDNGVEIQFFMFRWYTLLFTQEYEMPDVLRLWDSLLSFVQFEFNKLGEKLSFLNFLCLAAILMKKKEIIESDFAGVMITFQNMDYLDVAYHIKCALYLMQCYKDKYSSK